jgi:hypothetical protein
MYLLLSECKVLGIILFGETTQVNSELKQQCDGAGETSRTTNYGPGNTSARRTNTAKRASNMPMHHSHVLVHVCAISIVWNFHTNPYQSCETQVETTV